MNLVMTKRWGVIDYEIYSKRVNFAHMGPLHRHWKSNGKMFRLFCVSRNLWEFLPYELRARLAGVICG